MFSIQAMQKNQLIIMRHAKSDWSDASRSDFDRSLTARGKKAAKQMGQWLKQKQYRIDRILCSPALRAKQTCQLAAEQLDSAQQRVLWEDRIYEASLNDLITLINQYGAGAHTLLIVGHNPGLDQLLCHLCDDPPLANDSGKLLTTAATAVLDYGTAPISAKAHQAHLQCLIRPKEL
ncbi:phosphohistidine phosphatase SixA [Nitrosomonas sp.]|uniref:phosphohistidine phosphatase SixA n=1 Tax=Nitrosomonas sp. TaxID=42353 RepID=UPI0032EC957E